MMSHQHAQNKSFPVKGSPDELLTTESLSPARLQRWAGLSGLAGNTWGGRLGGWGTGLLRLLPPEVAHEVGLAMLKHKLLPSWMQPTPPRTDLDLGVKVPGIGVLKNPIGLAAGFDKNAVAPEGFRSLGLSMIEVGTVTPRAQEGNPKPRLFRYPEQQALINRMGFNNDGAARVAARLRLLRWNHDEIPLGVNCGKNKDTPNQKAVGDYLQVITVFSDLAKYFVINISSPNTPGLRELATPGFVQALGQELGPHYLPRVWIKIDPDRSRKEFQALVGAAVDAGYQGLILSNTHRVQYPEAGGQSGHPLAAASNTCLEWAYQVHKGKMPMIATGGILSGVDVLNKIARGASAVQIYTALVYQGPWAVTRMLTEVAAELKMRGYSSLEEAKFSYYES